MPVKVVLSETAAKSKQKLLREIRRDYQKFISNPENKEDVRKDLEFSCRSKDEDIWMEELYDEGELKGTLDKQKIEYMGAHTPGGKLPTYVFVITSAGRRGEFRRFCDWVAKHGPLIISLVTSITVAFGSPLVTWVLACSG